MQLSNTQAAIMGIVVIEVVALLCGINGSLMMASTAIIAGLGGYSVARSEDGFKQAIDRAVSQ